jgi:transcriptional regulator with XRE-family HTH domain
MAGELGKKLKELREARNLTQSELAEKIGVKMRQVQRYEGGAVPRPEKMKALNRVFGFDFYSVMDGDLKGRKDYPPSDELNRVLPMGDLKITLGDYLRKVEDNVRKVEEHNAFLQKLISDKTEAIDQNLKKTLAYAARISLRVDAASEVALESLARLEKKPEGSLTSEVGKEVANLMKGL